MKGILLLIFLMNITVSAQSENRVSKISDSLQSRSYFQLYEQFFEKYKENPKEANIYANAYLEKGKSENKKTAITHGYFLVSYFYKGDQLYLNYTDSIIQSTQDSKNKVFSVRGYLLKGNYFLNKALFLEAWNSYKKARNIILLKPESKILYPYSRSIGLLKSRLGQHEDAIKIFRECYQYASSREDLEDKLDDMFFLANSFNKLKLLDSASHYNKKGIRESLEIKNNRVYSLFMLNSGITNFHKKDYLQTIDSISKILPYLKTYGDTFNLTMSYYYLGKAYSEIQLKEKSIDYLNRMDSLVQVQKDIFPDMIEGYKILINHSEDQGDFERKLIYSKKLYEIKNILNNKKNDLLKTMITGYNTPLIVLRKDTEISNLYDMVFNYKITISVVFFLLFVLAGVMIYFYNDRNRYRKSFRAVVSHTNKMQVLKSDTKKKGKQQLDNLNISAESIQKIMGGINNFEKNQHYLNKKYTLNVLAKELKTNSTYLSKIINVYKEKSFSNYLHDLRIGYAIESLRDYYKFRLYSIKAISEEVGFKTSESFAKAFHKKTRIYPSSFIKKLKHL